MAEKPRDVLAIIAARAFGRSGTEPWISRKARMQIACQRNAYSMDLLTWEQTDVALHRKA
jgi:hypothetical protein